MTPSIRPSAGAATDQSISRPITPPLNPLAHLLDPSTSNFSDDEDDDKQALSTPGTSIKSQQLVPDQNHSIIQERAVIRYYLDPTKEPIMVEDSNATLPEGSASADGQGGVVDVCLLLDVTNGCGGKIWPAAQVLGAYLTGRRDELSRRWKDKTVVELGSGTGLVGFVVAKMRLGATTWITDQDAMLSLMAENLSLNSDMDPCYVDELNWGEPIPSLESKETPPIPPKPDVLLLADCVYLETAFQPLVDTMVELSTSDTEILVRN